MNIRATKTFLHALLLFCLISPKLIAAQIPDQICASTTQIQQDCASKPADTIASMLQTAKNPLQALDSTVKAWQTQGEMGMAIAQEILGILRAEVPTFESHNALTKSQEKLNSEFDLIALCEKQVSEFCKESQLVQPGSGSSGTAIFSNHATIGNPTIGCPPNENLCNATGNLASQYCCRGPCNSCAPVTPTPQPPACAPPSVLVTISIFLIPFNDSNRDGQADPGEVGLCPRTPPTAPLWPPRIITQCRNFVPGDTPIPAMCAGIPPSFYPDPTMPSGPHCLYFDRDDNGVPIQPPRNNSCDPFVLRDYPERNPGDPNLPPITPILEGEEGETIDIPLPIHREL